MTKKIALALIEDLGCTVLVENDTVEVSSPEFHVFSANLIHSLVYDGMTDPGTGKSVWRMIIEDLNQGIETCAAQDYCDVCLEEAGLQ